LPSMKGKGNICVRTGEYGCLYGETRAGHLTALIFELVAINTKE